MIFVLNLQACNYYNFGESTLYTATTYFDRFLSVYQSPVDITWAIQLAAVACLSLAAKIEEVNVPFTVDLQAVEPKFMFEGKTIQRMELMVLNKLKWEIKAYTPLNFLDYYLRKLNHGELPSGKLITRSIQIILITIQGIQFLEFWPSEIAAAMATYVSNEIQAIDIDNVASTFMGVEKENVVKCFELIQDLLSSSSSSSSSSGSISSIITTTGNATSSSVSSGDCVGAIDGTYISANVPFEDQLRYYNRKGHLSQNVMAICDFDCCFMYVYPGWEGSANDARVLLDAVQNDPKFPVPPPGKYYLVDSCYTNFQWFMSPYRSQRYHLEEFRQHEPNGEQELFNQMHAKLRNAIERSFCILKMRFPILRGPMPQFSLTTQIDIVIACCAIHNFIRKFSVDDELFCYHDDDLELEMGLTGESRLNATNDEIQLMGDIRDGIAEAMWNDYNA
ncbi:hypothetical protein RD792_013195 [Penstemon davidsonii]|uniref:Uncharacterized protein n=1 Tax=Penstemon davidsonii TaxID=160366 RepID=A0ABR0CTA6_9LAMI|nr:hypothetical protein RD792_013195 [Penstemon davidsonii]